MDDFPLQRPEGFVTEHLVQHLFGALARGGRPLCRKLFKVLVGIDRITGQSRCWVKSGSGSYQIRRQEWPGRPCFGRQNQGKADRSEERRVGKEWRSWRELVE